MAPTVDDDNDAKNEADATTHHHIPSSLRMSQSVPVDIPPSGSVERKSNDNVRSTLQLRSGECDDLRVKCLQSIHSEATTM